MLIGFVAGRASDSDFRPPPVDASRSVRLLFGELSSERRLELDQHFRAYFDALRPRYRDMRSSQRDFRTAMTSDPLKADKLHRTMSELTAHICESQTRSRDSFVALAEALTPRERQQLVDPDSSGRRRGEHRPPERNGWRRPDPRTDPSTDPRDSEQPPDNNDRS